MSEIQIPLNSVISRLKSRVKGYNQAIEFFADSDAETTQATVANYRAIVGELETLLEDYQDLKYRIEFGH